MNARLLQQVGLLRGQGSIVGQLFACAVYGFPWFVEKVDDWLSAVFYKPVDLQCVLEAFKFRLGPVPFALMSGLEAAPTTLLGVHSGNGQHQTCKMNVKIKINGACLQNSIENVSYYVKLYKVFAKLDGHPLSMADECCWLQKYMSLIWINPFTTKVAFLRLPGTPPKSQICDQIMWLYCCSNSSLVIEASKLIFCTRNGDSPYFSLRHFD